MTRPTVILVSGLPRSGKTSLADALSSVGFTHVPLDRYFRPVPFSVSFLAWVASPDSIDWRLVERHIAVIDAGESLVAPTGLDMSWGAGGMHEGGVASRRVMRPSLVGYAVPGCHSFSFAGADRQFRVFVRTPRRVIAERVLLREVASLEADAVLDTHLSPNWRTIEEFEDLADVVVSGLDPHEVQLTRIREAMTLRGYDT